MVIGAWVFDLLEEIVRVSFFHLSFNLQVYDKGSVRNHSLSLFMRCFNGSCQPILEISVFYIWKLKRHCEHRLNHWTEVNDLKCRIRLSVASSLLLTLPTSLVRFSISGFRIIYHAYWYSRSFWNTLCTVSVVRTDAEQVSPHGGSASAWIPCVSRIPRVRRSVIQLKGHRKAVGEA